MRINFTRSQIVLFLIHIKIFILLSINYFGMFPFNRCLDLMWNCEAMEKTVAFRCNKCKWNKKKMSVVLTFRLGIPTNYSTRRLYYTSYRGEYLIANNPNAMPFKWLSHISATVISFGLRFASFVVFVS